MDFIDLVFRMGALLSVVMAIAVVVWFAVTTARRIWRDWRKDQTMLD